MTIDCIDEVVVGVGDFVSYSAVSICIYMNPLFTLADMNVSITTGFISQTECFDCTIAVSSDLIFAEYSPI